MTVPVGFEAKLDAAATQGLDLVHVAVVYFGGVVGTKYYSTRPITGIPGVTWEGKLRVIPDIPKRSDPSAVRFDALNDDLTLRIRNTPESESGHYDSSRLQDLVTQMPLVNARVDVGVADVRSLNSMDDIKWDGVYRVERVDRDGIDAVLYCVDRLLHRGEHMIGSTVNDADWPYAPDASLGTVRGPVFGKVDGLPLVPVEVGLFATLSNEIDDQDGVIEISGDQLNLWPSTGFVEIGDEVVYYPVIDQTTKRLGSTTSRCTRGTGFPATTPAAHANGAIVREAYTGRESTLNGAITATATSITLSTDTVPAGGGVILVDGEAIRYVSRSGFVLSGVTRGVPIPTIAKTHDIGTPVRTIPVGPDGLPRYRYLVAEGAVDAVSNIRVQDESGNDLPYAGGATTLSQVTPDSGKTWSILDLPARPRFEKFESSGTDVPQEWICATDGRVDTENVALPAAFIHWAMGAEMSQVHAASWPRAIDPSASTRAVILEATTGKNVFSVTWDGKFDSGLNSPRHLWGRFRNARLRMLVQYDRSTTIKADYQVHSNGVMQKAGNFPVPTVGGGTGGGQVTGSQQLPQTRWNTQVQSKEIRLGSSVTDQYADGNNGMWIDPIKVGGSILPGGGRADHSAIFSGDRRAFLSGWWRQQPNPGPQSRGSLSSHIRLLLNNVTELPPPSSGDRLKTLVITLHNPEGRSGIWTGYDGSVAIYANPDGTGASQSWAFAIGKNDAKVVRKFALNNIGWGSLQSLRIAIDQWNGVGSTITGTTVGQVTVHVEYEPDVEGQRVGTIVDGSYFRTSATTTPSAVYEQRVSLGQVAKDWARANGRDPWDFFTKSTGAQPFKVNITLPNAGDGLQFAVADVFLELEYEALSVVYDGTVLADVDGRTGVPLTGGAAVVLQNPVDLLAYLMDDSEFYGMAGDRDEASFLAARLLAESMGWKMARAVTEPIALRELMATLCAESRTLLLAEGLKLFARFRFEEATLAESVLAVGEAMPARHALVRGNVPIVNRLEDVHNSLGCYYRRNYVTGDYRTVIEEADQESARLYGDRRMTPNLDWHQSARGYEGGFEQQKVAVLRLTKYMIDKASRVWDYATFEVPPSAGEMLQRYDVMTLNWPRSGYYMAPGRVMTIQRVENPVRFAITAEMGRSTNGYLWQSAVDPETYIKLAEAGVRMDFVIAGQLVAQLTSAGHWRCRGNYTEHGSSVLDFERVDTGAEIIMYFERSDAEFAGQFERFLELDASGNTSLYAHESASVVQRKSVAPGPVADVEAVSGFMSPGAVVANSIEFYLANRLVMYINNDELRTAGRIRANLGVRMGSAT